MVGTLQMRFAPAIRVSDAVSNSYDPILTISIVLRLDPSDRDALRTKLFLLLQTEQYDTALALIAEINEQCSFERAYALYRLQREEDAAQVLKEIKNNGKEAEQRGAMHLEAQLVSIQSGRFN
jgi:signal recognition particle subunit SRP72